MNAKSPTNAKSAKEVSLIEIEKNRTYSINNFFFQIIKKEIELSEPIKADEEKVIAEPVMPEDLPVRRKRTAEMAGSYDWTPHLVEPGFCAAPVSCFKHVNL